MSPDPRPRLRLGLRGSTALLIAIAIVTIVFATLPAYRLFFLISLLIGILIAGGLTLWNRSHPIEDKDVENKRPLGL